jgi:hypothetical protein
MVIVIITKDPEVVAATEGAFQPNDDVRIFSDWSAALDACSDAELMFVDLIATLDKPHRIAGYERFAEAKMAHPEANAIPLVLIAAPDDYELDFMTGYPNFVFMHVRRPLNYKVFRRATTYV